MTFTRILCASLAIGVLAAGCSSEEFSPAPLDTSTVAPEMASAQASGPEAELQDMMEAANTALANAGASHRVAVAEWVGQPDGGIAGGTVLSRIVGNKQLSHDFVPFDTRRPWGDPGGGITYAIDRTGDAVPFAGGLTQPETDAAIERATDTWDDLSCSDLPLSRTPTGLTDDLGFVAGNGLAADVQHAGWRDIEFSGGTIGVTFTFLFCAPCGMTPVFTDIDGNGKLDTAFREIYYDPFQGTFGPPRTWLDDGVGNIDVETVALHEIGHGLSQAHFGTVRIKNDGSIQASPRAVMNALYTGPFRDLAGTDDGGHCSNWANWPNN